MNKAGPNKSNMLDKTEIAERVPHDGTMCLIDKVLNWDQNMICCTTSSHHQIDNPLRNRGQLSAINLLEYGAQAMAIHGSLIHQHNEPFSGYLAAIRSATFTCEFIHKIQHDLIISAFSEMQSENGVIYTLNIQTDVNNALMEARAMVIYQ